MITVTDIVKMIDKELNKAISRERNNHLYAGPRERLQNEAAVWALNKIRNELNDMISDYIKKKVRDDR